MIDNRWQLAGQEWMDTTAWRRDVIGYGIKVFVGHTSRMQTFTL